jgi:hypothetical protein
MVLRLRFARVSAHTFTRLEKDVICINRSNYMQRLVGVKRMGQDVIQRFNVPIKKKRYTPKSITQFFKNSFKAKLYRTAGT